MAKAILVVLDGLRYDAARRCLGWLEGMVAAGEAQVHELRCALPALSRPLYETLATGLPPVVHGTTCNEVVRLSPHPNIFAAARAAGLVTAAAAYSWWFELFNRAPFTPEDRRIEDHPGGIRHGVFYWDDAYPDSHLFADAQDLIRRHEPDLLLLHPMNVDDEGHRSGGVSRAYDRKARSQGDLLARWAPRWRAAGYALLVTADHGMSDLGEHSGPEAAETRVPLYTLGPVGGPAGEALFLPDPHGSPTQLQIAGLLAEILGLRDHGFAAPQGILTPRA